MDIKRKGQDMCKKERLSRRHELETADDAIGSFLKPMSREDFLKDIETAEQEMVDGKCNSAEEVFNELERRYGL